MKITRMKAEACRLVDSGYSQRMAGEAVGITQKSVWMALRDRQAATPALVLCAAALRSLAKDK